MRKRYIALICILMSLCLTACNAPAHPSVNESSAKASSAVPTEPPEAETAADADELIKDMITCYGCYGRQADEKVAELLDELQKKDSRRGKLWKDIMDYWDYANHDLVVNTDGLPDDLPDDDSLCFVVLGYQLNPDGSMQDELLRRLALAYACALQYPNAYVVCTGGGTAVNNRDVTEADQMGKWLIESGLEEERLIIENRSLTTAQNAEYSHSILTEKYPQVTGAVIVSSSYHIPWGAVMFEAEFMRSAAEGIAPEMHVISNCAFLMTNDSFPESELLRWQTGGMLELIGEKELAMEYYRNEFKKPEL